MKTFLLLASLVSFAQEETPWKIVRAEKDVFLENQKDKSVRIPVIVTVGSTGRFKTAMETINKDIVLLIYESGTMGTEVNITEWRAVVFNKRSKKALADLPWKYLSGKKGYEPVQPRWTFFHDKITVVDEAQNVELSVPLD